MTDLPVGVTLSDDATTVAWWHQMLLPRAGLMRALLPAINSGDGGPSRCFFFRRGGGLVSKDSASSTTHLRRRGVM